MNRLLARSYVLFFLIQPLLVSKADTTPVNALHSKSSRVHALTHATLVVRPGEIIENATLVVRDGYIEAVGIEAEAPNDARIWNMTGKTIYAGFIDAYTQYGMPDGLKTFVPGGGDPDDPPPKRPPTPEPSGATSWNPLVTPEREALDYFTTNKKTAKKISDAGFTTVATYPARGIFRGQGLLIHTDGNSVNESTVTRGIAQHIAFDRWQDSRSERPYSGNFYPTSTMGSIALVRQTLYDAQWYQRARTAFADHPDEFEKPDENQALEALQRLVRGQQMALFKADDELGYQRIQTVAQEFEIDYAILGNGYEYRRAGILGELGKAVIVPLSFPQAPQVERPDKALTLSLEQLQHWELAPSNPVFLVKAGIPICFTAHYNSGPDNHFWDSVRKSVKRGLGEEQALAALTTTPAELYGVGDRMGTLEKGKIANLTVATGNLFSDPESRVSELWIQGNYLEKNAATKIDLGGEWIFDWNGVEGFESATIQGKEKPDLEIGGTSISLSLQENELLFFLSGDLFNLQNETGIVSFQAFISEGGLTGSGQLPDGRSFGWSAHRKEAGREKENKEIEEEAVPTLEFDRYPAGVYGVAQRERIESVLIQNATLWTSGPDGILEQADLLIKNGKIADIDSNLKAPRGVTVIDVQGKHVTPGLIDCHSHIAGTGGINEGGAAITAEVRIGDIINPVDINIYRQLAGGLTTTNILHGSANPMGGQSQVLKLRWGLDANGLKFEGARPSVKFALGENVKQSRNPDSKRYPHSRLGVEQFFVDQFRAAEDYERQWTDYKTRKKGPPPRLDLRMAATLEILRRERVIHIHSYRQDEILMFARLAKSLNLEVAAFQHILEGYKVADVLADIEAGGSSFSDWWAYKFEVIDAIPYNGTIMHNAGVVTSFNSDDAELASRLNTEATKAVKYGGLSEEEALKFVTLNPAIQLRIDDRVGSLENGKDADFVIWSDHPLSTYAHSEQTWIDGIKYFDKEESHIQFQSDSQERQRLIQKALSQRMKALKSGNKKASAEQPSPDESSPEDNPEWIYHNGSTQYSCSAEEKGIHL